MTEIPRLVAQLSGARKLLPPDPDTFVVEEKFDGIRGLIQMDRDENGHPRMQILNRHGLNKGRMDNTPKLVTELLEMSKANPSMWDGTVLDGELAGETWNQTMHLLGSDGQVEEGLRYIVFDLLYLNGQDIRDLPWSERRSLLEIVVTPFITEESVLQISKLLPKTMDALAEIWARGGEGTIVKDVNAPYAPGDRKYWGKYKAEYDGDGIVMRFTAGNGKYSDTFGAVVIGQYDDQGNLVEVSQMSGMTDTIRRQFDPKTDVGRVLEFRHYGKTVNRRYRHPQWRRWRDDKDAVDCTWADTDG